MTPQPARGPWLSTPTPWRWPGGANITKPDDLERTAERTLNLRPPGKLGAGAQQDPQGIGVSYQTADHPEGLAAIDLAADLLARISTRTVYAALAGDEALIEAMRDNGKLTPEVQRLHDAGVPEEVKVWVRAHFWAQPPGDMHPHEEPAPTPTDVQEAVASVLAVLFRRLAAPTGGDLRHDAEDVTLAFHEIMPGILSLPISQHCNPLCVGGDGGLGGGP